MLTGRRLAAMINLSMFRTPSFPGRPAEKEILSHIPGDSRRPPDAIVAYYSRYPGYRKAKS